MARQIRIEYPGAIYHVMARGNRREAIVLDEPDREGYEKLWGEAVDDLEAMKKGDARKITIAALLRQTTTVDLKWISRQLNMGATTRISAGVNGLAKGPSRDRKLLVRLRKSCEAM